MKLSNLPLTITRSHISLFVLLLFGLRLTAQAPATCCSMPGIKSATESFAAFSAENDFVMSHDLPGHYVYTGDGEKISFPTASGKNAGGWLFKSATKTKNYIFVIHEWWGLNDYVKRESERLRDELGNVNVIALDLYDGKVATDRENAAKYMQEASAERCSEIISGGFSYAGKKARIGTIGWCFGGGWSHQAGILAGKQGKACVIYYGMPENNTDKLKSLKAPVLGQFAKNDGWINAEAVGKYEAAMTAAGKKFITKWYEADHAFANPSNPKFDNAASDAAWRETIAFFKQHLK